MKRKVFSRNTAGFTIMEAAVILGIVGIVMGGLWGAASEMYKSRQMQQGLRQWGTIGNHIQVIFANQAGILGRAGLTQGLDRQNAFPTEMRRDPNKAVGILFHPWSSKKYNGNTTHGSFGTAYVTADSCSDGGSTSAIAQPCFRITFSELPRWACIRMLVMTSSSPVAGLNRIYVNGRSQADMVWDGITGSGAPLSIAQAIAKCDNSDNNNNYIDWIHVLANSG
ncbi:MAG: hypothetical protein SFW62_03115 [Alphaproteobacteria bacterium]|nr:hypothetical protein [Alphaproteobacteria bacterium]